MKIRQITAALVLAATGILAAPAAAEAIPPPCHEKWTLNAYPGSVRATGFWYCAGEAPLPLPVTIEGFFWTEYSPVATGSGEAVYLCQTHGLIQRFRVSTKPSLNVSGCG